MIDDPSRGWLLLWALFVCGVFIWLKVRLTWLDEYDKLGEERYQRIVKLIQSDKFNEVEYRFITTYYDLLEEALFPWRK